MNQKIINLLKIALPILIFFLAIIPNPNFERDYKAFITGAQIVLSGKGHQLYEQSVQFTTQSYLPGSISNFLPFRNPPFVTIPYIPLAVVDFNISIILMCALFVALLSFAAYKLGGNSVFYIFCLYFITSSTFLGQPSIFILVALCFAYLATQKKDWLMFGILTSLILVKVHYLVALPFLIFAVENKKEFLKGFGLGSLVLFAISALISGPTFGVNYIKFLIHTENFGGQSYTHLMYSVQMILHQLVPLFVAIGISLMFYLGSLGFVFKNRAKLPTSFLFALSLLIIPLFGLHTFGQELVFLSLFMIILTENNYLNDLEKKFFIAIIYVLIPVLEPKFYLFSHLLLVGVYVYMHFIAQRLAKNFGGNSSLHSYSTSAI